MCRQILLFNIMYPMQHMIRKNNVNRSCTFWQLCKFSSGVYLVERMMIYNVFKNINRVLKGYFNCFSIYSVKLSYGDFKGINNKVFSISVYSNILKYQMNLCTNGGRRSSRITNNSHFSFFSKRFFNHTALLLLGLRTFKNDSMSNMQ